MTKTNIVAEPGKQDIVISRIFDAPQKLVFKTWTDPQYIPEWWGPRSITTVVDKLEARKGGIWRFVQYDNDGNEYAHNGVYHEVVSPNRLVNTYEFEGVPSVGLVTTTFEEQPGGKTMFTETSLFPSVEVRNGVLQSGMTEGAVELMERLEELLKKLQNVV